MNQQTLAIHAGYEKDAQSTMAVPIYQSTAYEFRDTEHAANLFALKELGNIYTRLMNPTTDVFEKRFAAMEGGVAAVGTSSGMAAIFYAIANVAEAGDNIIVAKQVYGGTTTLSGHTIKRFGIETRYFNVRNPDELETLIDEKTKIILFESITNPSIDVADIGAIVEIADKHGIISCVDNTVATPVLCQPLAYGVDLTVHSTSKYTTGQGLALGGIIVERENLVEKIKGNDRYYHFNTPDASYHGLVYSDVPLPLFTLRVRLALLRDLGGAPSPFNSWLHIQGLETLPLRMKQHSESALAIAKFLESHPKVKRVNYPGLEPMDGPAFTRLLRAHLERFGVSVENAAIQSVTHGDDGFLLEGDFGEIHARAVIAAVGTEAKRLDISGAAELEGSGLFYDSQAEIQGHYGGGFFEVGDVRVKSDAKQG